MPAKRFHHTSWIAFVTSTDRPKSVRNRYVVFCVVTLLFFLFVFVGIGAYVIGLSHNSSFFLKGPCWFNCPEGFPLKIAAFRT